MPPGSGSPPPAFLPRGPSRSPLVAPCPPHSPAGVGDKAALLDELRGRIRHLEGGGGPVLALGVAQLDRHLPGGGLALGCLHEIAGNDPGDDGAAVGFTAMVLGRLAAGRGRVLWLTRRRDLYPPGLAALGLAPDSLILLPVRGDQDTLWAMEEALNHRRPAAVAGEVDRLDLVASRRLQLATERRGVTGLLLRPPTPAATATAAVTRWRLASVAGPPAARIDQPRWQVELQRCRGGRPGQWVLEWNGSQLLGQAGHDSLAPPAASWAGAGAGAGARTSQTRHFAVR